jgi:hypothetical protein
MKSFLVDQDGYYGEFGGAYVPEILHKCVEELTNKYLEVIESEEFKKEFEQLLRDYVGRPSPLYLAKRLSEKYGCKLYLKREDLNHTGAHKINNTIGQILLARRMGKKRIIAETGAGQHGVATATVCALMDMECIVYMGKTDVERQHINVEKMKMLGATVIPVTSGNMTLKDATNEAIRDWCCHPADTYYIIGSTVGPHPYPDMVARLQSVISEEIKKQLQEKEGRDYPDYLIACVGGGSNAAGTIYHYINDERVVTSFFFLQLFFYFFADNRLQACHHIRIRMRAYGRADNIISVGRMATPVADRFVGCVFQGHVSGSNGNNGSSQHFHFLHIDMLAFYIRLSHINDTFHIHQRTYGSCCYSMLSGSGFGDDAFLSHAACQQDLSDGVVDFVCTGMIQVFPFQIQLATILFGKAFCQIEWGRTSYVVA